MKRLLITTMGLLMTLGTQACSQATSVEAKSSEILIVYFSRVGENYGVGTIAVGNTAMMATYIQEEVGGTLFEIVPTVPYPNGYEDTKLISQKERDEDLRPAIKNRLDDIDKYSVVFVGSPIWYGGPAKILETFYEAYPELAEKILIPFGTHEGSGTASLAPVLKQYFPKATIKETLGLTGREVRNSPDQSRRQVSRWIEKLKIAK